MLASLCVLVAISVWLRTRGINFYYWIDEGISVGIASHPLSDIPALMRQDGAPPLYYLILHVWMAVFGRGEVATHELSLIFSLLCIPTAYWAGSSLFDRRAGLIAAVLAAGSPYLTIYGQETRMYSFVSLLSIVIAASFVQAFIRRRRGYLPVFSLSLTGALYSHNWALFLGVMCAASFLWCLWRQPAERRSLVRDGGLAFGIVAVLFAPWLPTLLYQARHTGAPWDLPPVIWSLSQGLYLLVGGRGVAMLVLLAGGAGLLSLRIMMPATAASPAVLAGNGNAHRPGSADLDRAWPRLAAECLLILGLGTLLLAWVYAKTSPAWAPRYLAVIVGPLLLVFALGLARAGRMGLVALALSACFWILDPVPTARDSKSNVAPVAAQLRAQVGSNALVLATQPEQIATLAYYLPAVRHFGTPLGPVPDPRVVDWRNALARFRRSSVHSVLSPMLARLTPGERVLLVVPINFPKEPLYMRLINRASNRWSYALSHDPHLHFIATSYTGWNKSGVAVQGYVYEYR